jgi:preprotein translocase subunit SecA
MDKLKLPEGEAIEAGMVSRSIESAQRKVEARNFDIRKQLLEYDDVANDQRRIIYKDRNEVLDGADVRERIDNLRQMVLETLFREHVPLESIDEQWDLETLHSTLAGEWNLDAPLRQWASEQAEAGDEAVLARLQALGDERYRAKLDAAGHEAFAAFEKTVLLQAIDNHWRDHLATLDYLRQGIHLRGYAQKNPKQEYKREAFELFGRLQDRIRNDVVKLLMSVTVASPEQVHAARALQEQQQSGLQISLIHAEAASASHAGAAGADAATAAAFGGFAPEDPAAGPRDPSGGARDSAGMRSTLRSPQGVASGAPSTASAGPSSSAQQPLRRYGEKVGRNDPCPCGSGRKYKLCHGKVG